MKRGTVKKKDSVMVALWVPKALLEALDAQVRREADTDRSKVIRRALRRSLNLQPTAK